MYKSDTLKEFSELCPSSFLNSRGKTLEEEDDLNLHSDDDIVFDGVGAEEAKELQATLMTPKTDKGKGTALSSKDSQAGSTPTQGLFSSTSLAGSVTRLGSECGAPSATASGGEELLDMLEEDGEGQQGFCSQSVETMFEC
eukprot:499825-Amphidinium_carterae.2